MSQPARGWHSSFRPIQFSRAAIVVGAETGSSSLRTNQVCLGRSPPRGCDAAAVLMPSAPFPLAHAAATVGTADRLASSRAVVGRASMSSCAVHVSESRAAAPRNRQSGRSSRASDRWLRWAKRLRLGERGGGQHDAELSPPSGDTTPEGPSHVIVLDTGNAAQPHPRRWALSVVTSLSHLGSHTSRVESPSPFSSSAAGRLIQCSSIC